MNCNGINVEEVHGMIDALRSHPEAGTVVVRTRHRWDDGAAVHGHGETIEAFGEVLTRTHHTFRNDLPESWGGRDSGPAPTESVLAALAACVAGTYAESAALQGVDVDALEVTIETRLDLRGTYELDSVRPGLSGIAITLGVRADADDTVLDDLGEASVRLSPTADSLANPVPLQLRVRRLP